MAEIESPPNQPPVHPDVDYEHSDVSGRGVVITTGAVLISAWIFFGLLYYFFVFLIHYREHAGPLPASRAIGRTLLPPEPRLQESPRGDLEQLRAVEDSQLNSYRWIDRKNGIVSIPIDRAIDLTAQRGIPPLKSTLKVCDKQSPHWQAGVGGIDDPTMICPPKAGTRNTGTEGKVEPEPR